MPTALGVALLALASVAAAQTPREPPPGPWVADLRGATGGTPSAAAFYPTTTEALTVPTRGFGGEAGVHVYLFGLGPARIGFGASVARVRGTAAGIETTLDLVAPQLSFNFGTRDGWSYLSAGLGSARIDTTVDLPAQGTDTMPGPVAMERTRRSRVQSVNFGGGARWFLAAHAAVGFDVRFHRLSRGDPSGTQPGTPSSMLLIAAVGLSVK